MTTIRRLAAAFLLALAVAGPLALAPARAQFADQATFVATVGGGSANAQTFTISNVTSLVQLRGVLVKVIPGFTNTGAATFNFNSLGGQPVNILTNFGLAALVGGEIQANEPIIVMWTGTAFVIMSGQYRPVGSVDYWPSGFSFTSAVNLQINAAVASNALTIAIKTGYLNSTLSGADPTVTNPVRIAFRDPTIANGGPIVRTLSAALSFTINSTNTMGCRSGVMCRLWVVLIDNAGTLALCAYNANSAGTSIIGLDEAAVQTSASGTTGGSSAQTLYCSASAVSAKAIRYLGYIDVQEATAGTWATAPTLIQLFGPGVKKAGDVVKIISAMGASQANISSGSDTNTNATASVTPSSAANLIKIGANIGVANATVAAACTMKVLRGGAGGTQVGGSKVPVSNAASASASQLFWAAWSLLDQPNATSAQSYTITGAAGAGTCVTNQGDVMLQEIMGALEPANDDGAPRREVA